MKEPTTVTVVMRYRYLTGPDDSSFCDRVTEALNDGWELAGSPTLAHNADTGQMVCGQAITRRDHPDDIAAAS